MNQDNAVAEARPCDVCHQNPPKGVASSSMGAVSWAYCQPCLTAFAEPECMFAYTYEMCGDEVADWVRGMSTFMDGKYITWNEYAALKAQRVDEGGVS